MGIFDFVKGQFIDVIAWEDDSRDTIIWKFPRKDNEIKMGAQLTVRESQAAIFINEGKLADVFQPGRHELATRNLPILSTLQAWKHGFNSPFKADVYFVNTRQFSNLKWGTPQPIMISDPDFTLVPVRAFGTYNFRVKDPALFMREFAGTDKHVTVDELGDHYRGMIINDFTNALKKSGQGIQEIFFQSTTLGEQLLPQLQPDFEALGLQLTEFTVSGVSLPEDIQAQLTAMDMEARKTRKVGAAQNEVEMQRKMQEQMLELQKLKAKAEMSQNMEDMQKFLQLQQGIMMENMANNPGGGGMMGNMMQGMMGMNLANQMMNQPAQQNQQQPPAPPANAMSKEQVMATLKELGELKAAGILTDEEFNAKKAELLSRL